jgi:hypothetical protein
MSFAQYLTIGQTVPYNYLIDTIENFLEEDNITSEDIIEAANEAKKKLQKYYPTADGLVYVIGTSK